MAGQLMTFTQNRELSWLKFNERVLDEACDISVPVLERLKFVSIFTNNLDEFFMVRVGSLFHLKTDDNTVVDNKTGWPPSKQLKEIFKSVRPLYAKRDVVYAGIEEELSGFGVYSLKYSELESFEKKYIKKYFAEQILPILSPLVVDVHHPFPHLPNKSVNIVVKLGDKQKNILLGLIPLPESLPPMIVIPSSQIRFILPEYVIYEYAENIFSMYSILNKNVLAITRNADINYAEEDYDIDDDFRYRVKKLLGRRSRMSVVRLELAKAPDEYIESYLRDKLLIEKDQVFITKTPMKIEYIAFLQTLTPKSLSRTLTYPPFTPQYLPCINENDSIIRQVRKRDIFMSFPFDRMEPFLRLVKEAAHDPAVVSLKISIYRLASKTRLVDYLCAAAENGKDVTVLIELRARFDEQNNINWSERLEEAGCNVIYGFDEYKIHAKLCLITRKDKGEIQYITQIGTGNYNEVTAELYTDVGIITAHKEIGQDAANFFKDMAITNLNGKYKHLLVAPNHYKSVILSFINEQTELGANGRITIKINSLSDLDIAQALSVASVAGVAIQLIIRGICCIIPGVPGKTENIRVVSVVGRFLEHSRIYSFGEGVNQKLFICSGDLMTRNTTRRVEVACPVLDQNIKKQINLLLETILSDNVKARVLRSDGFYEKISPVSTYIDSQETFMQQAITQAREFETPEKSKGVFQKWLKRALERIANKL